MSRRPLEEIADPVERINVYLARLLVEKLTPPHAVRMTSLEWEWTVKVYGWPPGTTPLAIMGIPVELCSQEVIDHLGRFDE